SVQSLNLDWKPTKEALGLSGKGTIALTAGGTSVTIGAELSYDDPKNWSLKADGLAGSTWTPVPGLAIKPQDVPGSITAKDDAYELSLKVAPSETWRPTGDVSVDNLELALSTTCPETGAPCPTDAKLFTTLTGDATFTLPSVGDVKASLAGVLALPSG